jgi:hypothetical protein
MDMSIIILILLTTVFFFCVDLIDLLSETGNTIRFLRLKFSSLLLHTFRISPIEPHILAS